MGWARACAHRVPCAGWHLAGGGDGALPVLRDHLRYPDPATSHSVDGGAGDSARRDCICALPAAARVRGAATSAHGRSIDCLTSRERDKVTGERQTMASTTRATFEELAHIDGKAEIVNGEIVLMSPTGAKPG